VRYKKTVSERDGPILAARMSRTSSPWKAQAIGGLQQIAGLIARRIVFNKKAGHGARGGVGLIKFSSHRCFDAGEVSRGQSGDHVKGRLAFWLRAGG
jgi:hypothetical protein